MTDSITDDCTTAAEASSATVDRLVIDPPMHTWSLPDRRGVCETQAGDGLIKTINRRAHRLGLTKLVCDRPIIATGHQAFVWHPGILAKDIAAAVAAEHFQAQTLHLVVDQDVHPSLTLDLPAVCTDSGELAIRELSLGTHDPAAWDVPTGYAEPLDAETLHRAANHARDAEIPTLAEELRTLAGYTYASLAEQLGALTVRLMQPWTGPMPLMLVSDLVGWQPYEQLIADMLADARRCVRCYNRAAAAHPQAGMTPLGAMREVVELPLWAVRAGQSRQTVWADLSDRAGLLVFKDGQPVDRDVWLILPRALTLTAVMRSSGCGLFIHGLGGGEYERITEQWWREWQEQTLSPMAVVTADVRLQWDETVVPVADAEQLRRAIWFAHHLPHNVDRVLGLEGPLAQAKRQVLQRMAQSNDRPEKAGLFERLHEINDALCDAHAEAVEDAEQRVESARQGLRNRMLARRRDWPFVTYPSTSLEALVAEIRKAQQVAGSK